MKIYKNLSVFILILFCFLIAKTSLVFSLDFNSLPFCGSYPETYSLLMVDSSLSSSKVKWQAHEDFTDIGPALLRSSLADDDKICFEKDLNQAKAKNRWIIGDAKELAIGNDGNKEYFIVQLFKKHQKLKAVNLMEAFTPSVLDNSNGFIFQASLIIFPYQNNQAMVYGFGKWNMLLNHGCIIPQWGLRMLASSSMCNPDKVKRVLATHHRASNPSSRNEKTDKTTKIEKFVIEVGSEGLDSMSVLPNKSYKTSHLITGSDHLKFTINPTDKTTSEETIKSLDQIATHFFEITNKGLKIHDRMKEFLDEELKDEKTLASLNDCLLKLIRSKEGRSQVFPHNSLWGEQQTKVLRFGDGKNRDLFDALETSFDEASSLKVKLWKRNSDIPEEVDIMRFLYSHPIEHEGSFFRFDRLRWYSVDASRFESIKRIMRETKLSQKSFQLPFYSFEDTERSQNKTVDYKEANYNSRTVKEINKIEGWEAILLDRLNVYLGGSGNQFEFADLFLRNKGNFYIVHIKRDCANQLSHHREQVERSADFLVTELKKESAQDLFLKGVINSLYHSHSLSINKIKGQGQRLTKGEYFQHSSKNVNQKNKNLKDKLDSILLIDDKKYNGAMQLTPAVTKYSR